MSILILDNVQLTNPKLAVNKEDFVQNTAWVVLHLVDLEQSL